MVLCFLFSEMFLAKEWGPVCINDSKSNKSAWVSTPLIQASLGKALVGDKQLSFWSWIN